MLSWSPSTVLSKVVSVLSCMLSMVLSYMYSGELVGTAT